jgi:apolipoprotein D and lipocalin family protein
MNIRVIFASVLLVPPVLACAAVQNKEPLRVVPAIDFERYAGKWYEIARFPNRFQKRCAGEVTAEYTLRPDGKITVLNRCRLANGDYIQAKGLAKTVGQGRPNSVLKVRFAPAFLSFIPQVWGDYQVLALSPDYQWAVVGDPGRQYLWILSRTPAIDETTYSRAVAEAAAQGFDTARLEKTLQLGT